MFFLILKIHRACGYFIHKYGRISFIESFNEYWLETEARLRKDFNLSEGYRPKAMAIYKRKSGMKAVFKEAGMQYFSVSLYYYAFSAIRHLSINQFFSFLFVFVF